MTCLFSSLQLIDTTVYSNRLIIIMVGIAAVNKNHCFEFLESLSQVWKKTQGSVK